MYDAKKSLLGKRDHGTAIFLTKLRDSETFRTAVIEKLSMAYRPHLLDGDQISVNENQVLAKSYDLIDDRKWDIKLEVNGHKMSGWYSGAMKMFRCGYKFAWYNSVRQNMLRSVDIVEKHLENTNTLFNPKFIFSIPVLR